MKVRKNLIRLSELMISFLAGKLVCQYQLGKKIFYIEERADRNARLINVFYLWMKQKQNGKHISSFLIDNGFYKVAIYGMHFLGECLYDELKETDITVLYGIDKNVTKITSDLRMMLPTDKLEEADAVIVTPVFYFNEIERQLSQKISCPVISLEDILENL